MPIFWLNESCKKGEINHKKLWKCYDSENYDSLKLASKLVGSWEWISEYNIWAGITTEADKAVHITMTPSGGFSVTENSIIVTQGNWQLNHIGGSSFVLELDPQAKDYFYGNIILCDDDLLFYSSPTDGPDYLFVRM